MFHDSVTTVDSQLFPLYSKLTSNLPTSKWDVKRQPLYLKFFLHYAFAWKKEVSSSSLRCRNLNFLSFHADNISSKCSLNKFISRS